MKHKDNIKKLSSLVQNKIKEINNRLITKLKLNLNQVVDTSLVDVKETGHQIPKIIHQVYFNDKNLPEEIRQNITTLKKMNSDWEYRLYDDDKMQAYVSDHYPEVLKYYNQINPKYGAAKADFFRYLVIYREGGVYLDIKSSLSKPLNEIIKPDDCYILARWPDTTGKHFYEGKFVDEFQQWHIIATAGHPFLKAVIENVCLNIKKYNPFLHSKGFWGVLTTTGPIAYTLSILPILDEHKYRLGTNEDFNLVYSIFSAKKYTVHHQAIFKTHYTQLKESITIQPEFINFIFYIVRKFKTIFKPAINQ